MIIRLLLLVVIGNISHHSPTKLDLAVLVPDRGLGLAVCFEHEEVVEDRGAEAPDREEDEKHPGVVVEEVLCDDREEDDH